MQHSIVAIRRHVSRPYEGIFQPLALSIDTAAPGLQLELRGQEVGEKRYVLPSGMLANYAMIMVHPALLCRLHFWPSEHHIAIGNRQRSITFLTYVALRLLQKFTKVRKPRQRSIC